MDKQPVGQLPDLTQSNNDDEIMVITNSEYNQLKKEKISDFITDLTSSDEGNAIEKGADGKLFVSDTVDTSNIEGVLSLDNIPQLTTEKLPNSGVNSGFYRNPVNLNVNAKGQITSVEDGESGVINDITPFVTNTILSAQNPNITNKSVSDASYVNQGCTVSESNVVSGFSANNYILLSKTMTSANAFTLEIPFTTGSDVNTDQTLLYINNHANSLGISGGKIVLRYDGNVLSGTTTLAASTAYVALLTRTASNYTVQVKTASGAYGDAEITLASTAGYFGGKSVYLGGGDANYFQGTIDLANLVIQENASNYWTYTTLSSFQTVTVSGTYQLLMPDGRNSDRTMKNVTSTITLNDTLLYSPANGEKTLLVKEDGEVMIRDTYAESYNEPADFATGGVFFNKTENTLNEQLATYPNFINTGVTVSEDGIATGFSASAYIELPESYELGNSWEINWSGDLIMGGGSTIVYTPSEDDAAGFKAFKVTSTAGEVTAQFKRPNVFVVNREITVSTAYEVTKQDTSGEEPVTVTGYVQTAGTAESYVTAGTQVYSDTMFETPLEQAAADTWTYTGNTTANTEVQTGYTKTGGVTLVPADTVVYSDANCTSVQATASGTDYTYTGDTVESIICTLTDTLSANTMTAGKIGFNGSQYYFNEQTYSSTDTVKDNVNIVFGSDGQTFLERLSLPETTLTISGQTAWDWNGVTSSVEDFVSFVGAKLGKVTDNGTSITAMELDMPLTLAKDTDVVHITGDEEINGSKTFNDAQYFNNNLIVNEGRILAKRSSSSTSENRFPGMQLCNPLQAVDITKENLPGGQALGRFAAVDTLGKIIGGIMCNTTNGQTNSPYLDVQARRYYNGASQAANLRLGFNTGNQPTFEFPRCTTRPSKTSTAANNRVAVVVQNYLNGTSWYRVWSDGFIEQGGRSANIASNANLTINLIKPYTTTNYTITIGSINGEVDDYTYHERIVVVNSRIKTTSAFSVHNSRFSGSGNQTLKCYWYTAGY